MREIFEIEEDPGLLSDTVMFMKMNLVDRSGAEEYAKWCSDLRVDPIPALNKQ